MIYEMAITILNLKLNGNYYSANKIDETYHIDKTFVDIELEKEVHYEKRNY